MYRCTSYLRSVVKRWTPLNDEGPSRLFEHWESVECPWFISAVYGKIYGISMENLWFMGMSIEYLWKMYGISAVCGKIYGVSIVSW